MPEPLTKPSLLPVDPAGIPAVLTAAPRWVGWTLERAPARATKPWTKVPRIATAPTRKASSTDASTWRPFDAALGAYEDGRVDGIGFVLGDGFAGIDRDACITPDGALLPPTQRLITLAQTYTERSPSATGVHLYLAGDLPPGRRKQGVFEIYATARYFCVTGQHLAGTPHEVNRDPAVLRQIYDLAFPAGPSDRGSAPPPATARALDDQLLARARQSGGAAFTELFAGRWQGHYPSPSEADAALILRLLFWTSDLAQVERLMRRSGLVREKWDALRGGVSWLRRDIARAHQLHADPPPSPDAAPAPPLVLEPLPAFLARQVAAAPPMAIEGFLPGRGLALVHGQPRCQKSLIALEAALALATGSPAFGSLAVPASKRVAYLSNEDDPREVARRLRQLLAGRDQPPPDRLLLNIRAGLWLDNPEDQAALLAAVGGQHVEVLVLDPLRSLTGCVDAGPKDLLPFTRFLRALQDVGGVELILGVHHDVKPPAVQEDQRARPLKASGGGIFSIADSPLPVERVEAGQVVVIPSGWKFGADPAPLEIRLAVEGEAMRLTAHPVTVTNVSALAVRSAVLVWLSAHPDATSAAISAAIGKRKADVIAALHALETEGLVDCRPGRRQAQHWFVVRPVQEAG